MANSPITWSHRLVHSLPVRISLVVLTTVLVACVCPFIFVINRSVSPTLLRIVVMFLVGLAGGLSASALLSSHIAPIRYGVAWLSMYIGLVILHFLTIGFVGIAIPSFAPLHLDAATLGQLTLGTLAAGLALVAWKPVPARQASHAGVQRRSKTKIQKPDRLQKRQQVRKTNLKRQLSVRSREITSHFAWKKRGWQWGKKLKAWKIKTNASLSTSNEKVSNWLTHLSLRSRTGMKFMHPAIRMQPRKHRHGAIMRKTSAVRLVGKAKNRCPYCLEVVKPGDPRGIKICPECNTYHHADCWAVTGTCQVPHYHE